MPKGYLALVLHAHLPFVRHPEDDEYLEERWLFEAISETYVPLLQVYQGLIQDGVDFRLTMSITPTLAAMLTDKLLQTRYRQHMSKLLDLTRQEVERTKTDPVFHDIAQEYLRRFEAVLEFHERYGGNLITAFREIQDQGKLEIITSAATHAFLPLVSTEEAIRAQIHTAVQQHEAYFHRRPKGIWLPECGFSPGIDKILRECGIEYFFTETHAILSAQPSPILGTLSPVVTSEGVAVFARDRESSKQVWSAQDGYPGDYEYREYYRDIGHDLDFELVERYLPSTGIRVNTGLKYYRITGDGVQKAPYNFERAREKAVLHAGNFMFNREKQVEYWQDQLGRTPIIVAPYDAELFGHWWYEGPIWIDMLLRKIHFDQSKVKTITPSEYLQLYSDYQVCKLGMSSWGRDGFSDVWLREENDWIYPALHWSEKRMIQLASRHAGEGLLERRALNQAARELMLAQSSDWAFIMDNKTMVEYAVKRTKYHLNRFTQLFQMVSDHEVDEEWLGQVEELDNIFPELDFKVYRPLDHDPSDLLQPDRSPDKSRILMLSWEFPPMMVGGLSRHVFDLSRFLVRQGLEVHVLTTEAGNEPLYEIMEGVHVHRVQVLQPDGAEFFHWVFQLNLAMIDACRRMVEQGLSFHLIHAHDWLVFSAANALTQFYSWPLVATIHATEYGRNHGIHSELQRAIHHLEWKLTKQAHRVIVCSDSMKKEVEEVFQLPCNKVVVLPNGVDPELFGNYGETQVERSAYALDTERIVLFVGRLVREKGVETLLEAAGAILDEFRNVKFIVVGKGPMMTDLQQRTEELGIQDKVLFTGFVPDEERNLILQIADVAVFPSLYEPFGIVALEAMAAGAAVVVSDTGGLADVVQHEQNGLKMYPGDADSLVIQVKMLLRDANLVLRCKQAAKQSLKFYDWAHIARQTSSLYLLEISAWKTTDVQVLT